VKTFESTYQCLRKTNETCSLRKMVENTYGIRKAIAELSCEMKASALDHSSCVEDILIKQNLDKCARTYILPEISQRRPCIQPDTITVGEGPKTKYVHGVKTVNECNFQCAREPGCTNWVFNSKNESCILKQNRYNSDLKDLVAAVRVPKAGFTSGLLCDDPSHEINMTEYSVHQECLNACDNGADWDKCYDKMRNRLPDQPPICGNSVNDRCFSCKNSFLQNMVPGVGIPENLAAVRIKRECGAQCEEHGGYRDCFGPFGIAKEGSSHPMSPCGFYAMSCSSCKERMNELELKLGTQTIATPFETSSKGVSDFEVGGIYIGADSENAWEFAYVDQTVAGFDAAASVTTVATIEECRFRCQMSRTCEFFVFSSSKYSCALKTGAPYEARKRQAGSVIGTKYKGITCGSRIHTQMQTFNQSFETAQLDIRNRFPVCSKVCRTHTSSLERPQALQMLTSFPNAEEAEAVESLQELFDIHLTPNSPAAIYAVFTDKFRFNWLGNRHHFAIYVRGGGVDMPLLYSDPDLQNFPIGTQVELEYYPEFDRMLGLTGLVRRKLYWGYGTQRVYSCDGTLIWDFPTTTVAAPSRHVSYYRTVSELGQRARVRIFDMKLMGPPLLSAIMIRDIHNFFGGNPPVEGPEEPQWCPRVAAIDNDYLQLQNDGTTTCKVCCVQSPLLELPPTLMSCEDCRKQGAVDPMPGFPIMEDSLSSLCIDEPVIPVPIPLPKCYPEPRKLGILDRSLPGVSSLCLHENLKKIVQMVVHAIQILGFAATAVCVATEAEVLVLCEAGTCGLGTPACALQAASFFYMCAQLAVGTMISTLTISTVGRAMGCPEFSGQCTKV